ncbi:MAG: metal ABC transporter ATP-binding protein [Alphaproteobacteria bacterium]|nr:metal ABC transporter ATP-binding protein [Alphaproteobacteria bacterium]
MDGGTNRHAVLIAARGLGVRAGGHTLIERVDLELVRGEIVTLIGPNGAGKSTLVKALLGLVPPSQGSVWRKEGLRIGYTPQSVRRDPTLPLTVERVLRLGRRVDAGEVARALAAVEALEVAREPFHAVSGGELQRVLLARALLQDPELLVLDEPVAGVDLTGQARLYELVAHLRDERGFGVLLVSHDLHLVMARADRVICLNGHVCCTGAAKDVVSDPAFVELFGPRIAGELAFYVHAHDHVHDVHGHILPAEEDR